MKPAKIYNFIEKWGEIPFFTISIATLPIWFPLLAFWVILDPAYRMAIRRNRGGRLKSIQTDLSMRSIHEEPNMRIGIDFSSRK